MAPIRCLICGRENPSDAKYCIYCGSQITVSQPYPVYPQPIYPQVPVPVPYYPYVPVQIGYQLIFPNGKVLEVRNEFIKRFGREDFVNYLTPKELKYITRKVRGGHFEIIAQIRDNNIEYYIRDLNSSNGTLLDGEEIKGKGSIPLKDGSVISPAGIVDITFKKL